MLPHLKNNLNPGLKPNIALKIVFGEIELEIWA
jgi:hypothetical protein